MQSIKLRCALFLFTSLAWFSPLGLGPLGLGQLARGQETGADLSKLKEDAVFLAWQGNAGVQQCGVCHYEPGNEFAKRSEDFCRLTELKQWLTSDKHAIARQRVEPISPDQRGQALEQLQRLFTERGAKFPVPQDWVSESNYLSYSICKKMGYDVETDAGYAKFRDNCMTCHGGYAAGVEPQNFTRGKNNHPGISCNYCHQISENTSWVGLHSNFDSPEKWRAQTPEFKASHGMRNLASAQAQTKLCYSCHIGDHKQNMFVTHQMYAAGHPPLPGVELDTLVAAMPRHWRTAQELYGSLEKFPARDTYFQVTYPELAALTKGSDGKSNDAKSSAGALDGYAWRTSATISGAIAAQQQWLELISQAAEPNSKRWGDYALYDCSACHHELRKNTNAVGNASDRQLHRAPGAPGRPRLIEWPKALAQAVAATAGKNETLTAQYQRLVQATNARPFGERAQIGQATQELHQQLEQLKNQATNALNDRDYVKRMIVNLCNTSEEVLVDYHAARQVNWAIRTMADELGTAQFSSEAQKAIAQLGKASTTASEGQTWLVSTDLPGTRAQQIFPVFLKAELERQAEYRSQLFVQQLRELALLLK